jgi:hypothetical protein
MTDECSGPVRGTGGGDLGVFLASFLERTESQARLVVGEGVAGAEDIVTAAPVIAKVKLRRRQTRGRLARDPLYIGTRTEAAENARLPDGRNKKRK